MPTATSTNSLLSAEFMHKLDRLDVISRKILAGRMIGERRSKKKGQSVEFADYRPYVAGDDLRFIDWNLYARLERLFLRLFIEEEDLTVALLVDVSASMSYGEPDKFLYAKRVAAAMSYISLTHYNRLELYAFAGSIVDQTGGLRGRRPIPQVMSFLDRQQPVKSDADQPAGNLASVMKRFALSHAGKGVVIVLSDFLEKSEIADALRYLAGDRFDVYAIQVLCPQELDPQKAGVLGDLRLTDIEDGNVAEVSVSPALLKRYKANLQAYCQHIREQCNRRGIVYMVSDTTVPFEQLVMTYLRQRGLVG